MSGNSTRIRLANTTSACFRVTSGSVLGLLNFAASVLACERVDGSHASVRASEYNVDGQVGRGIASSQRGCARCQRARVDLCCASCIMKEHNATHNASLFRKLERQHLTYRLPCSAVCCSASAACTLPRTAVGVQCFAGTHDPSQWSDWLANVYRCGESPIKSL